MIWLLCHLCPWLDIRPLVSDQWHWGSWRDALGSQLETPDLPQSGDSAHVNIVFNPCHYLGS